jgi:uncharacterized protein YaiI (UPF0178 family)
VFVLFEDIVVRWDIVLVVKLLKSHLHQYHNNQSYYLHRNINTNIKMWLFTDEMIFTIKSTGTIAWVKAGTRRPIHYFDNIKPHVQLWGVV